MRLLSTACIAVLVTAIVAGGSPPSDTGATQRFLLTSGQRTVICDAALENPHYSKGFGGVIFKTRITCRGDAPPVQFRLRGTLGSVSGGAPGRPAQGPPVSRATSDDTQTIAMGTTVTYYTPKLGDQTKVRGSASYEGNVTGEIVGPPGIIAEGPKPARSNRVHVTDPG